jgi:predicted regulator of amino acid metabolism with ACT domain
MTLSSSRLVTRYHHFIPQFILRNFAHEYQPASKPQKKRRAKNRIYLGDKLVNGIKLDGPAVELVETKVAKTFGVQDLYVHIQHPINQKHIEEMFSKLENRAAEIILKIHKNFEAAEEEIALKRVEKM